VKTTSHLARKWGVLVLAALPWLAGCSSVGRFLRVGRWQFLAPEKVIEPPEGAPINPIMGSIGPTDRARDVLPNASFPRDEDLSYTDEDYIIGPEDIVDISVLDLFNEGLETVLRRQVSASGYIDLPLLTERVHAEGYTKDELKEMVIDAYSPNVLRNPTVSVTVAARRQNTFSILGAVSRPGTYNIMRRDMRMLEALALAGGVSQTNIDYVYIIRPKPAVRIRKERTTPMAPGAKSQIVLPPLPPEARDPETRPGPAATQPKGTDDALRELGDALKGVAPAPASRPATKPATKPAPAPAVRLSEMDPGGAASQTPPAGGDPDLSNAAKTDKWIYSAGKWVRAREPGTATKPAPGSQPAEGRDETDPFGWKKVDKSDLARIIAVNLNQLRAGEPRMNIVIRDNDVVHVPTLEVGEFYVMGEVLRPGVYSLTGRQITVKMAMAASGNLSALAWPENSILIRRIDGRQEQAIPLDLEAIFQGKDPDVFLKPNDVIAVGTEVRSSFLAVMRNAFRMTYGFGFIYDRNFDDVRFTTPTSKRFTRW